MSCDNVFSVGEKSVVACFSCRVFNAFSVCVDIYFVDCGFDSIVGKERLCVGGKLCRVFLELVVNDNGEEIVVFVFHCVCECN